MKEFCQRAFRCSRKGAITIALLAALSTGVAPAHNLDQQDTYISFDEATLAVMKMRVSMGQPMIQAGDVIGMILKSTPGPGTETGVGGYMTFYIPEGTQVVGVDYLRPDGAGSLIPVPIKGQSIIAIGSGPVGPATTPALIGLNLGPNYLGVTEAATNGSGEHRGTIAGVYADTGIFYSTDPDTTWLSWENSGGFDGNLLTSDNNITNNRGEVIVPISKWDAEQLLAYGSKSPISPIVDPNGRGNTPWGLGNVVAGPESGYAWEFDRDVWTATMNMQTAVSGTGPWKRVKYPGSQISMDMAGLQSSELGYAGVDASEIGVEVTELTPLSPTLDWSDGTSPKAIRISYGLLELGRSEYSRVRLKILADPGQPNSPFDANGCFEMWTDAFGGDAGGEQGGKDHLWRYYDPTVVNISTCGMVQKIASDRVVSPGQIFQYAINVINTSTAPMTNVVVTDALPSGISFISAVPAQNSGPNPLVWNFPSIAANSIQTITLNVRATGSGNVFNTVSMNSDQGSSESEESVFIGYTAVLNGDKTVTPSAVAPGDTVTYTMTIRNDGTGTNGTPLVISEFLPTGFTYVGMVSQMINGGLLPGANLSVNSSNPNRPVFTVTQGIQTGKNLVLKFDVLVDGAQPVGTYSNSYSYEFEDKTLATGPLAPVTVGGGVIGDTIYRDWDGDGMEDAEDEGLPGVTVELWSDPNGDGDPADGALLDSEVTDANGNYSFTGLAADDYVVQIGGGVPAGYMLTGDPVGGLDGEAAVTLTLNEENLGIDFGYQPGGSGSIGDLVFEDVGNDGNFDSGTDGPIANVTVNLYEDANGNGVVDAADALVGSDVTDGSGIYGFGGLALGLDYLVDVDESDGDLVSFFSPNAYLGTTSDPHLVSGLAGAYTDADFGFFELLPGSIGDQVFTDVDGDAVFTPGTDGVLPNITVKLYRDSDMDGEPDPGELVATTSTDVNGTYLFGTLGPGNYIVTVDGGDTDVPGGLYPSTDQIAVTLAISQDETGADFPFTEIIAKAVDMSGADPGDNLVYTITPEVPGSGPTNNVTVTDDVPTGTMFVSAGQGGTHNGGSPGTVTWNLGNAVAGVPGMTLPTYACSGALDLVADADAYIDSSNPTSNFGTADPLKTRPTGNIKHGLVHFDLSSVPAGATITAATLSFITENARNNHTVQVRRALTAWTEGGVTWNKRDGAANWAGGGAFSSSDYGATVHATFTPVGGNSDVSADITALAQAWIDGTNNGLVFLAQGTDGGDANWTAREDGTPTLVPRLHLTYDAEEVGGCSQTVRIYASEDTYIEADDTGADNSGANPILTRPQSGAQINRVFYQFDLSAIPAGAILDDAQFHVKSENNRGNHTANVKRVTTAWTDQANWNTTDGSTAWTSAGGDFDSTVLGSFTPNSSDQTIDVTTLVSGWVDTTFPNYGVVLDPSGSDAGDAQWTSTEHGTDSERPYLDVTFRSPTQTVDIPVTQDTYLQEDMPANNQDGNQLKTKWDTGAKDRNSILEFDLSTIPSGSTVSAAELHLNVETARPTQTVNIRALTTSWVETTATWNSPWTSPGGDYAATAYGSFVPAAVGDVSANVPALVQDWVDGTVTNKGMILIPSDAANTEAKYTALNAGANVPYLRVTFTAPQMTGPGTTSLSTSHTVLTDGQTVTVAMAVFSEQAVTGVIPGALTVNGTGGASASYMSGPSPASQDIGAAATGIFTWTYSVSAGANPGTVTFTGDATADGPIALAEGTSNGVIVTDPLTMTVMIDNPTAAIQVNNVATISGDDPGGGASIPPTSTAEVETGLTASVGDFVWVDLDGDGVQDAGEPGLSGVQVCATDGVDTFCDTTDASGAYRIFGLDADTWTVSVNPATFPAGYSPTTPTSIDVALGANEQNGDADYGLRPPPMNPASIGDQLWIDADEDGIFDFGESALPGITVNLYNDVNDDGMIDGGDFFVATTTTDAGGLYSFGNLYPGEYLVEVDESSAVTAPQGGGTTIAAAMDLVTGTNPHDVSGLIAGQNYVTADFGYNWNGSIGDIVYYDENGNGVQDGLEAGAPDAVLDLFNDTNSNGVFDPGIDTAIALAITDAGGVYLFDNLAPGDYIVIAEEQTVPAPPSSPNAGMTGTMVPTTGDKMAVTLAANEDYVDADFGFIEAALVEGHVFFDENSNTLFDGGETGLPIITVTLTGTDVGGNPVNLMTETDGDGEYFFLPPPGDYTIAYDTGDTDIPANLTMVTNFTSVMLTAAAGQEYGDIDFGLDDAGTVGDRIFSDNDGNGSQGAGESGIGAVTVTLYDASGTILLDTEVTDGNGDYLFEGLAAATYVVRVLTAGLPPGYNPVPTADPDAMLDSEGTATIGVGGSDLTMDFGYQLVAVTRAVSGVVWDDDGSGGGIAGNGIQDGTEPGISGVTVSAEIDLDDDLIPDQVFTTTTDGTGGYSFTGITDGADVTVVVDDGTLPSPGYVQTGDPDATLDHMTTILNIAANATGQDFGYEEILGSISGSVVEGDGDGLAEMGEPPLAGVTVTLTYSGDDGILGTMDDVVQMTVTNGSGDYSFTGLLPGLHRIEEADPAGYWSIADADGGNPNSISLTLGVGEDAVDQDFEDSPFTISGRVINDVNANGVDDAESGIGGVAVELWTDPNGDGDPGDGVMDASTTTAGDGSYSFSYLLAGDYVVVETNLTAWWFSTADTQGANDDWIAVTLATSDSTGNDFLDAFAWYYWSNVTPGANMDPNPDGNSDGDLFGDLEEYAFDQDPSTGIPSNPGFCAMLNTGTGDIDATYIRPIGIPDVTYTLEGLADLSDSPATIGAPGPGGWFEIVTIIPGVVDNLDGTETVTYADLESVATLAGGKGFVRLRLDLASPVYSTYTQVFGWERTTGALGCETCSAPFMQKPAFAGVVDSVSSPSIEVAGSVGGGDVKAAMSASVEYYVEVVGVGNANEGQRFAVDYAASDADTIVIDTASAQTTLSPVPDLSGQSIVLRPFWTIGELFDPAGFDATNDADTADRLLFKDPGTAGLWRVYWLMDDGMNPVQWTLQGDVGMTDQADKVVDPCEGMFVHRRMSTGSLLMIGMVRANDFACPLLLGENLVTGGWAMDETPVERAMEVGGGFFFGGVDPAAVDQTHFWRGDVTPGAEGYTGYFLLDAGAPPYQYWTGLGDSLVTNRNATDLFSSNRSALLRVTSDRSTYVMPRPWTP